MTGKRFSVTQTILGSGIYDYQAEDELCESYDEDAYGEVCNLLNELYEENKLLKEYRNAILQRDPSKIIRVNEDTGEVDWINKEIDK